MSEVFRGVYGGNYVVVWDKDMKLLKYGNIFPKTQIFSILSIFVYVQEFILVQLRWQIVQNVTHACGV